MVDDELTRLMVERKAAVAALRKVDLPTRLTPLTRGRPPVAEVLTRERLAAIHEAEATIAELDRTIAELRSRR